MALTGYSVTGLCMYISVHFRGYHYMYTKSCHQLKLDCMCRNWTDLCSVYLAARTHHHEVIHMHGGRSAGVLFPHSKHVLSTATGLTQLNG